ncbi:DUF4296 domain-containing protein [Flavobacterium sp.]|uniref:DUF4296 domain-containing protein n=1 Tax=Flavobacterium sp. TaxID=239 RepID=UPI002C7286AD|nr:DUF4296 domain-containing protein [Flavobacterium sp.]HSD07226.1 DUF4296 domain-containing protein [Flavobacterium sp.]
MKKIIFIIGLVCLFLSCNKDLVEKPDNLIDQQVMENIFYDMSILEAIKYQNPNSLNPNGIDPKTYIFKKYNIDSTQLAQSNAYYAADYREYKKMFDHINDRLKKEKDAVDLINKKADQKEAAIRKAKAKKIQDSIKKVQKAKELKIKKEKDSLDKVKKAKELKAKKKSDSINESKIKKSLKAKK